MPLQRPCYLALVLTLAAAPAMSDVIRVTRYGAACNGITDDSVAIQAAFEAAKNGDSVKFPDRVCAYGENLILRNKQNVTLFGSFATTLKALNPLKSTVKIINGTNITIRKLTIDSPYSTARTAQQNAMGFFAKGGRNINFDRITVSRTANAGVMFFGVAGGTIQDSDVLSTWSDGIHITNNGATGSTGILVLGNYAFNTGDDSFSAVGYNGVVNSSIEFRDNASTNSKASGVTVEGGENVLVINNSVHRSTASGIRVASNYFFQTSRANQVTVSDNIVTESPISGGIPSIFVYAEYQNVSNIFVLRNVVDEPINYMAFQAVGLRGRWVSNIRFENNLVYDPSGRITDCINVGPGTSGVTLLANTLSYGGAGNVACD